MSASVEAELARARALTAELIELVAELRARLDAVATPEVRASRAPRLADGELRSAFQAARASRPRRPRTLPF